MLLGLTSLFTDLSSEMITAILPLYLTVVLGFTPLQFGAFDGTYQAVTSVLGLTGALAADRWRRHKEVAVVGYGLSAGCRVGLLAASGAWGPTMTFLYFDRLGKGLRTAPRDALISLSAAPSRMAEAFGVHRALDTIGALLGPLAAFMLLRLVPGGYDTVFVTSLCAAVIGIAILTLFVDNPRVAAPAAAEATRLPDVSWQSVRRLVRIPAFRALLLAGTAVSLLTLSDAFLYLTFQRRTTLTSSFFPLLYVGTALVYLLLAVPLGRLADRVGRGPVFLLGHLFFLAAYGVVLLDGPEGLRIVALVALVGTYYGATAGVLMAIAGSVVPPDLRTFGIALLITCIALARLVSSLAFGTLWSRWDSYTAVMVFTIGLGVALLFSMAVLRRSGATVAR